MNITVEDIKNNDGAIGVEICYFDDKGGGVIMEDLKLHKSRMFNAYESLQNALDEPFTVDNNTFSIMDLEYSRHAEFDDLEITVRYKSKVRTLKLFAKEEGIFNMTPYNSPFAHELYLTSSQYLSNNEVLKAICEEIKLHTQNFFMYYNGKQEVLDYLNQEEEL